MASHRDRIILAIPAQLRYIQCHQLVEKQLLPVTLNLAVINADGWFAGSCWADAYQQPHEKAEEQWSIHAAAHHLRIPALPVHGFRQRRPHYICMLNRSGAARAGLFSARGALGARLPARWRRLWVQSWWYFASLTGWYFASLTAWYFASLTAWYFASLTAWYFASLTGWNGLVEKLWSEGCYPDRIRRSSIFQSPELYPEEAEQKP
ncbi:hypothetical protein FB451DRAFT_1165825 [Mycena latifolia]|nr:hypothetical protein FB451DRAFT_1165825 [Mycena latifolia]